MDTSEQTNFEDNWRRAFDDASDTPPDSVWSRIEERLDEEDRERVIVLPLWRRWQSMQWAAAVALLAISLGGWWLSQHSGAKSSSTQIAKNEVKLPEANKERIAARPNEPKPSEITSSKQTEQPTIVHKEDNQVALTHPQTPSGSLTKNSFIAKNKTGTKNAPPRKSLAVNEENALAQTLSAAKTPALPTEEKSTASLKDKETSQTNDLIANQLTLSTPTFTLPSAVEIHALDGKDFRRLLGLSGRKPWVAYQAAENEVQAPKKTSTKEYFASMGIMPASYNAGVAIGGSTAGRAFALSGQNALANTTSSTNAGSNRPALSYAVQWQGGLQLNQRWSIETGVNYLQGNSIFEGTNGFNVYTNSYVNNLEAAVNLSNNLTKQYDFVGAVADKSQIQSFATNQNISNSYQYLQVPVQAGFAVVKPKRKLSLWLLGGLINNIFLRNSFDSGQERTVSVSGPDNPYKTLSLSASTGMRVQYKMNKRWTTLISGNYQHSLGSNTRSDALFEAKPQLFGIGAGLRYGF